MKKSTPTPPPPAVTPLGLAVAILILCLLAYLAIPRLQAVSAERSRPEAPRVLSSSESSRLPSVGSSGCCVGECGGNLEIKKIK
jgi:cytochrome c-type biogenesis protein CcmH/NrfG